MSEVITTRTISIIGESEKIFAIDGSYSFAKLVKICPRGKIFCFRGTLYATDKDNCILAERNMDDLISIVS